MAKIIKFDALKKRIIKNLPTFSTLNGKEGELLLLNKRLMEVGEKPIRFYGDINTNELLKKIAEIVEKWDIRQAYRLAEIFPDVVPSWVANCKLEFTENGWILYK